MRLVSVRGVLVTGLVLTALVSSTMGEGQGLQFFNLTPCRAVDTRYGYGGIVPIATVRDFQMKGICGVPTDAKTVALNVVAVAPSCNGFLVLYPKGAPFPNVSNINFNAGEPAIANGAVVPIAATNPDISLAYGSGAGCTVHVVLDLTGYFK